MPKSQQSLFIRAACHLEWSLSNGQKSKELPLPPCRYGQNGKLPKELRTPQEDFGPHVGWAFIQTNPILPESPKSPIHNLGRVWLRSVKFLKSHLSIFEVLNIDYS